MGRKGWGELPKNVMILDEDQQRKARTLETAKH